MGFNLEIGTVSLNEFAKRMGVKRDTVLKAMNAGKIHSEAIGGSKKTPRLFYEIAARQWAENYSPKYVQKPELEKKLMLMRPATGNEETAGDESNEPETDDDIIKISKRAPLAEAKRVESIHRAKIAELDLRERKGELIEKRKADQEYYAAGQVVRVALQSIPDKIIDNILAAQTRMEAHGVLTAAIIEALESLAKPVEIK